MISSKAWNVSISLESFDDALLSLEAVQNVPGYQVADKTWPHHPKYRYNAMPKPLICQGKRAHS
jgi:hypothetical protein